MFLSFYVTIILYSTYSVNFEFVILSSPKQPELNTTESHVISPLPTERPGLHYLFAIFFMSPTKATFIYILAGAATAREK